mmetsp:Transcript_17897/g.31108  ORF Transcript_17897/g.31108 Transcript_17897/m.31108 type:complete len:602 (-) Transcript_17897:166-1971(-)
MAAGAKIGPLALVMGTTMLLVAAMHQSAYAFAVGNAMDRPLEDLCADIVDNCDPNTDYFQDQKLTLEYTTQITSLVYHNTYVEVTMGDSYKAILARCGCDIPSQASSDPNMHVIMVPAKSVYVYETPAMYLIATSANALDKITAIQDTTYVTSQNVLDAIAQGKIKVTTTFAGLLDTSVVPQLPSFAVISSFDNHPGETSFISATEAKIEHIPIAEMNEPNALARAEWMKIMGLFFLTADSATTEFNRVRDRYNEVKATVARDTRIRPSIAVNSFYFGYSPYEWYSMGQASYTAQIMRDAGAEYRLTDDFGAAMDGPKVLKEFKSSMYWLNHGHVGLNTMDELIAADKMDPPVYRELFSSRCDLVYTNLKRLNADKQGSDYLMSGIGNPDLILLDMFKILHPEVSVSHELYYYIQMAPSSSLSCPVGNLPVEPAAGTVFVNVEMDVSVMNQFAVEDIRVDVEKAAADVVGVDASKVQLLSIVKNENAASSFIVRFMVEPSLAGKVKSLASKIVSDVQAVCRSSASTATVTLVNVEGGDTSPEGDGGLSGGAIAGIVIGSVVGAALIVLAVWFLVSKKKGASHQPIGKQEVVDEEAGQEVSV